MPSMFSFRSPQRAVDWHHLQGLDLGADVDVDELQRAVSHLAGAKIIAEELATQPAELVCKLARALQMGIDFLGCAQSVQDVHAQALRADLAEARAHARALAAENERLASAAKMLKRDAKSARDALRTCKQLVALHGSADLAQGVRAVAHAHTLGRGHRHERQAPDKGSSPGQSKRHTHEAPAGQQPSASAAMEQLQARVASEVHRLMRASSAQVAQGTQPTPEHLRTDMSEQPHNRDAIERRIQSLSIAIDQRIIGASVDA